MRLLPALILPVALAAAGPFAALAAPYQLNKAQSSIGFEGIHAGQPFTGTFQSWDAEIEFDETNLATSSLKASFKVATATTGNATYDANLKTADWLDPTNHPEATFTSTEILPGAAKHEFLAKGLMNLRGIDQAVTLAFTLSEPNASGARRAQGRTEIDRLAFGLGKQADPEGRWVSRNITITLDVLGTPQPEATAAAETPTP